MSKNVLDQLPSEDLETRLKRLEDLWTAFRTLQVQGAGAVEIRRGGVIEQSVVVPANSGGYRGISPTSSSGVPIFTLLEVDYYQDVKDEAHEIGTHLNDYRDKWDLELRVRGSLTSESQINYQLYFFNHDTADHTLYWLARPRWILSAA